MPAQAPLGVDIQRLAEVAARAQLQSHGASSYSLDICCLKRKQASRLTMRKAAAKRCRRAAGAQPVRHSGKI